MKYNIIRDDDSKIIMSEISGHVTTKKAAEMGLKVRNLALELGYSIIMDWTKTNVEISIFDGYEFVPKYYDSLNEKLRLVHTIHIYDFKDKKFFEFIEAAWQNRGILTRCMTNLEEAIEYTKSRNQVLN